MIDRRIAKSPSAERLARVILVATIVGPSYLIEMLCTLPQAPSARWESVWPIAVPSGAARKTSAFSRSLNAWLLWAVLVTEFNAV